MFVCVIKKKKKRGGSRRVRPITHGRWYSSSRSAFGNQDQQPIFSPGANQFLNRGTMRLRCMSTLRIATEPPCTTASGPDLSPGYGFGPSATIWRNQGAKQRRTRKHLSANGVAWVV